MDLGILPPDRRKSVAYCLARGWLRVNLPVFAIMFGLWALTFGILFLMNLPTHNDFDPDINESLGIAFLVWLIVGPPSIAWVWWSYSVPQWRIWALRTVDDWPELERGAVRTGLIWPRGCFFEKTEFKSREEKQLEKELIAARDSCV